MCNKFLAICVSILSIGVCPLAAQSFDPGCALPPQLDQLKQPRQIDKQCSIDGDAPEAPHILQNRQKNNFCATGSPMTLTRDTFARLQSAAQAKQSSLETETTYRQIEHHFRRSSLNKGPQLAKVPWSNMSRSYQKHGIRT